MNAFGREVERIRRAKDITLASLGAGVQRSEGSISRILRGEYGEVTGAGRKRPPMPPLGAELEMWLDVLGTTPAEDELLRLLAGAAHCPDRLTREAIEAIIMERFEGGSMGRGVDAEVAKVQEDPVPRRRVVIRHAAEVDASVVPTTRDDPNL